MLDIALVIITKQSVNKSILNKRSFWVDSLLGCAFIFMLIGVFNFFTAFKIFDVFNPIENSIGDFEISDIVSSKLKTTSTLDTSIVLVNVGTSSRKEIAKSLFIIDSQNPRTVGIDVLFSEEKDKQVDLLLEKALKISNKLVMVSDLKEYDEQQHTFKSQKTSLGSFVRTATIGFANVITEEQNSDHVKTIREYTTTENLNTDEVHSFALELVKNYNPEVFISHKNEKKSKGVINYFGNIMSKTNAKQSNYLAVDIPQIISGETSKNLFRNKIVILCYLGEYVGDDSSIEDKFFTPLNSNYSGKSLPDMFGGVVHANIVTMILTQDYIYSLGTTWRVIIAIILCFLTTSLFLWIHHKIPNWYDGVTKLLQFIFLLILFFVVLEFYNLAQIKLELTLAFAVIALASDALEVYLGVLKNGFHKINSKWRSSSKK